MSAVQSLETIKKEIVNLTNSNALPSQSLTDLKQLDQLLEKIMNDYHNQTATNSISEMAEVLYDFKPLQGGDLALTKGDRITILEKMSSDWYKGKDPKNNVGVFPANYVKIVENNSRPLPPPPPPTYSEKTASTTATSVATATQTGGSSNSYYQQTNVQQQYQQQQMPQQMPQQQYQQPPYQQQMPVQQYQQPAPFPPPSTNYYQQQPQQYQQPVQQQSQQQSSGSSALGGIGSKLGNAFVFGAGATLGGDLVNAIL